MTTDTKTLSDFIEEHDIRASVEPASDNPNMDSDTPMIHWLVELHVGDDDYMAVPFSQGLAHTEPPTAEDVLDCLASDASMVEQEPDPIKLALELGGEIETEEDVDRARKTHDVIERQRQELERMLGGDAVEELLYSVERL